MYITVLWSLKFVEGALSNTSRFIQSKLIGAHLFQPVLYFQPTNAHLLSTVVLQQCCTKKDIHTPLRWTGWGVRLGRPGNKPKNYPCPFNVCTVRWIFSLPFLRSVNWETGFDTCLAAIIVLYSHKGQNLVLLSCDITLVEQNKSRCFRLYL